MTLNSNICVLDRQHCFTCKAASLQLLPLQLVNYKSVPRSESLCNHPETAGYAIPSRVPSLDSTLASLVASGRASRSPVPSLERPRGEDGTCLVVLHSSRVALNQRPKTLLPQNLCQTAGATVVGCRLPTGTRWRRPPRGSIRQQAAGTGTASGQGERQTASSREARGRRLG